MTKHNTWTPPPPSLLSKLSSFSATPPPPSGPPPTMVPRTDAPDAPFPFLSLPRELRDQVYTHTFPPRGLKYRTRTPQTSRHHHPSLTPSTYPSLLLTNRQIHAEALPLLFRTTTLTLTPHARSSFRRKHNSDHEHLRLDFALRSFPRAPASLVCRVEVDYRGWMWECRWREVDEDTSRWVMGMWEQVVRDAWTLQTHFPGLRWFTPLHPALEEGLEQLFFSAEWEGEGWKAPRRQERERILARRVKCWFERELDEKELVPPPWLRLVFERERGSMEAEFCDFQEQVMAAAHVLLAGGKRVVHEDREESGRVWLEGYDSKRKRGRKGWCKQPRTDGNLE